MNFIGSLRGRITAAFLLAASLLSGVLLLAVGYFAEDMERAYLSAHLLESMNLMLEQAHSSADFRLPSSATMRAYRFVRGQRQHTPRGLSDLSPGYQEVEVDGRELHVFAADDKDVRYVLAYDGASLEAAEEILVLWLVMGVVVMIVVITGVGYGMSVRIARPITDLADAIDSLNAVDSVLELEHGQSASNEVARLSRTFHDYSARLVDFMDRERAFTADVSHELRNPLMIASSAVELLEARHDLDVKARGQIARIRRAADRMQALIELFLSLSREPVKGTQSGPDGQALGVAFDVVPLAQAVVERYAQSARMKGLALNLLARSHPQGQGDSSMAMVALDNVIANAVQYTVAGRIDVIVDEGGVVVADSGPGIDESERLTVFKRLQRGAVGRSSTTVGFGLGLSIVSRICEHQGWRFDLQSVANEGTRASLSFDDATLKPRCG